MFQGDTKRTNQKWLANLICNAIDHNRSIEIISIHKIQSIRMWKMMCSIKLRQIWDDFAIRWIQIQVQVKACNLGYGIVRCTKSNGCRFCHSKVTETTRDQDIVTDIHRLVHYFVTPGGLCQSGGRHAGGLCAGDPKGANAVLVKSCATDNLQIHVNPV